MSPALCRKNVSVKRYFDEWDTWENMINLNWSLLIEGDIFHTWVILLEARENLGFALELQ